MPLYRIDIVKSRIFNESSKRTRVRPARCSSLGPRPRRALRSRQSPLFGGPRCTLRCGQCPGGRHPPLRGGRGDERTKRRQSGVSNYECSDDWRATELYRVRVRTEIEATVVEGNSVCVEPPRNEHFMPHLKSEKMLHKTHLDILLDFAVLRAGRVVFVR